MTPPGPQRSRRDESGQTTVLIVGFFVIAAMLVAVVVDASAAYLTRQRLDSLADGAALAAVDAVQGEQVYEGGLDEQADIDPALARQYVAGYLDQVGAHTSYAGLSYQVRTTAESVEVTVQAPLDLPLTPPGFAQSTMVTGAAAAYVDVVE